MIGVILGYAFFAYKKGLNKELNEANRIEVFNFLKQICKQFQIYGNEDGPDHAHIIILQHKLIHNLIPGYEKLYFFKYSFFFYNSLIQIFNYFKVGRPGITQSRGKLLKYV